jgi:hypothetical protein
MDPAFVLAYETHFAPLNPWEIGPHDGLHRPVLLVTNSTPPPEPIDRSEFEVVWLRPQGDLRYPVNGAARLGPEETMELMITRSRRAGTLDERLAQTVARATGEGRQVVVLCAGQPLAECVGYSGTSMNTIKTHLKRVCDKIGEARHADLVRRMTGNVALRFGSRPQG